MFSEVDFSAYLYAVFIGVLLGAIYAFYNKRILGKFVRKLLEDGCDRVSKAESLAELGFGKSRLLKFALRDGSSLSRVVVSAADNMGVLPSDKRKNGKRQERDFVSERFYIPADLHEKAERTYDSQGTTVLSVVLTAVVFYTVLILCYFIVPVVTDFTGGMIKSFYSDKTGGDTVLITDAADYYIEPETP